MSRRKTQEQKIATDTYQPYLDDKKSAEITLKEVDTLEPFTGWFDASYKAIFDELVEIVKTMETLTEGDRLAINLLVDSYKDYVNYKTIIDEEGEVVHNRFGTPTAHPLIKLKNQALQHMISLAKEFGLTPKSRSLMYATGTVNVETKSPLALFFETKYGGK